MYPSNMEWRSQQDSNQLDLTALCKDFSSSFISPERNLMTAKNIIQKLFKNKELDMCSIMPSTFNYSEAPFNLIYELINGYSPFFDTVIEDDSLCEELWNGVLEQCQASCMEPNLSKDSVLMCVISTYVTRLLPCDENFVATPQISTKSMQTIRTPLQLFKESSPLVNKIRIDDRTQLITSNVNLQPRLVNIFCSLIIKACSNASFPTPNRLLLLRYLLKQFHVFCLFETRDEYNNTLKNAMMTLPPFMNQLYNFLYTSLHHCPSVSLFKDITMNWLTYCRPWRYQNIGNGPTELPHISKFLPFARNNFDFYRILLGKIIKRFSTFEIGLDLTNSMRSIVEFSWKEPQCLLLRNLGLDIQPHVVELLNHMKAMVSVHKEIVEKENIANSGIFHTLFGKTSDSAEVRVRMIKEIEAIMEDSDKYLATKFLAVNVANDTNIPDENRSCTSTFLNETPKSCFGLPDHYVDPRTNIMILTPKGRKQVLSGERRFDFSQYVKTDAFSPARQFECAPLVVLMTFLAQKASNFFLFQSLADSYTSNSLSGKISRMIMFPPIPNLDPRAAAPVCSPNRKKSPPLLKLRIFSNYFVISAIVYLFLCNRWGMYFAIPSFLFGLFVVLIAVSVESDL